jgi:trimethylamine--corrinoid protein Co-methyltransferase
MEETTGGRRARSSGREGRQRLRAEHARPAPAYITRKIPAYELCSEDGLAVIEAHADHILEAIGFEIRGDEAALQLFEKAGCRREGARLYFPRGLVRSIITESAPAAFVQHARNRARSVRIGGDGLVFAPSYGSPFVADLEGGRRYGSIADFENFVKLAYASPYLHHSGGTVCEPVDLPVNSGIFRCSMRICAIPTSRSWAR